MTSFVYPKRIVGGFALAATGALVGAVALTGLDAATRTEPADEDSRPLDVDTYRRQVHGYRAAGYRPADPSRWRCSVWRNDVWGLEPVNLRDACRMQEGDSSTAAVDRPEEGQDDGDVVCSR